MKTPDGQNGDAVLRHGRGRRGKDKAVTKRWERCKKYMDNQAEFVACCAWLLKVNIYLEIDFSQLPFCCTR